MDGRQPRLTETAVGATHAEADLAFSADAPFGIYDVIEAPAAHVHGANPHAALNGATAAALALAAAADVGRDPPSAVSSNVAAAIDGAPGHAPPAVSGDASAAKVDAHACAPSAVSSVTRAATSDAPGPTPPSNLQDTIAPGNGAAGDAAAALGNSHSAVPTHSHAAEAAHLAPVPSNDITAAKIGDSGSTAPAASHAASHKAHNDVTAVKVITYPHDRLSA